MEYYSPLRYPGGKGKISDFIKSVFEKNLLLDGCYVEPYAGGASIALSLLIEGYASQIVINDIDRSIYAFWYSVINHTDEFCEKIDRVKVNIGNWRKQKEVQNTKETADLLDLGFSTFFLNRVNRSGIIKAGVIGGIKQLGNFKIDARFNKPNLISRIKRIANFKNRIALYNLDAIDLIQSLNQKMPDRTLIYLDPPYYVKGKDLYVNHYTHDDHVAISNVVKGMINYKWIVSYDNIPEIRSLYKKTKKIEYSLNYSAVNATRGEEIMFFHNELFIPRITSSLLQKTI
jgi:DNA adenine methylase